MYKSSKTSLRLLSATPTNTHEDDTFYVEVDHVIFLVEDVLFKVSRYPFVKGSPIFATMFDLPRNSELTDEGRTNSNPIALPGVTVVDFKSFLHIVHPLACPPFEVPLFGVTEWASVLRLSKLWMFDSVASMATPKLETLLMGTQYPFEAIVLGREFKRTDWLIHGYDTLIRRAATLSDDEAVRIGWTAAARILRSRENSKFTPSSACPSPITVTCGNGSCKRSLTPSSYQTYCNSCGTHHDNSTLYWKAFLAQSPQKQAKKTIKDVEDMFADEIEILK